MGLRPVSRRVVVRVREIVRVNAIVRVIPYTLGLSCQSQSYTGLSHVESNFYRFHKLELILYHFVKFQLSANLPDYIVAHKPLRWATV